MKVLTIGWISVFILILLMNIYIWYCYWRIPFESSRLVKALSYLVVHIALSVVSVYYFYLFFNAKTDTKLSNTLSYIAGFYLTFLNYSMLMYLVHDLVYLTRNIIPYPDGLRIFSYKLFFGGFVIFGIAAVISIISIFNTRNVHIKEYDIVIEKRESDIDELNIVYLADGHIGTSLNHKNIDGVIEQVNELNPDIVLLGGDFFDEGTLVKDKILISEKISKINSKYGTYAVEGNHEYKSGNSNIIEEMNYLKDVGINVLRDEYVKVGEDFYIVGRKDKMGNQKPLDELTVDIDEDLPVILLDHRPDYKETSVNPKISLQLSGHTHSGQYFPIQIFDFLYSKISKQYMYGHHKIGELEHIVSSGVGDWGIPVRMGSKREIVNVKLSFK